MSAFDDRTSLGRLIGIGLVVPIVLVAFAWVIRSMSAARSPEARAKAAEPRIVALSPALAVTLKDLGLADKVVGRHGFDMVLDKSVPVCGDQAGIDYEALLAAKPTHVLLEWGSRPLPDRLSQLAAERHWVLKSYPLLKLDDIRASAADMWTLRSWRAPGRGRARPAATEPPGPWETSGVATRMNAAWSRRGDFEPAGRILLLGALSPPAALGPGSFHQQILEVIGGRPAITTGSPFMTLDAEDALRLKPDGIIIIRPRAPGTPAPPAPTRDDLTMLLGRVGSLEVPAVRDGHVALIDDPLALTPSTAMIGLADEMAAILRQWSR